MHLVELTCPDCRHDLRAVPGHVIHGCPSCQVSWEVVPGRGLVRVPRALVRPAHAPSPGARVLLLPVWCIALHRDRLGAVAPRLAPEVRVPGCGLERLPLLVTAATRLTRAATPRVPWEDGPGLCGPSAIDAETAFAVAESVVLRQVPGWPPEDQVATVDIPLGGAALVDWPCAREGGDLVDLVGGLALPSGIVDDPRIGVSSPELESAIRALGLPRHRGSTPARG